MLSFDWIVQTLQVNNFLSKRLEPVKHSTDEEHTFDQGWDIYQNVYSQSKAANKLQKQKKLKVNSLHPKVGFYGHRLVTTWFVAIKVSSWSSRQHDHKSRNY